MDNLKRILFEQGYSDSEGVYSLQNQPQAPATDVDEFWSSLAEQNPIHAAAASRTTDWFAKSPTWIYEQISAEDQLWLDAGCGYGRVALPLLKNKSNLKLVGVDASRAMLKIFSSLVEKEPAGVLASRLLLLHSMIHRLPFPEGTFDGIFSCAVLLHNPYSAVTGMIGEFHRLLKDGGCAIFSGSFPNLWNPEGLQNWVYSGWFADPNANGPVRPYSRRQVVSLFTDWKEVSILPSGAILIPRQIGKLRLPLGRWIGNINGWMGKRTAGKNPRSSLWI